MAKKKGEGKPKSILLRDPSDEVWTVICGMKVNIMGKNKKRGSVSNQEVVYKLILNNCQ